MKSTFWMTAQETEDELESRRIPNLVKITHFISFSGATVPATAENYKLNAIAYTGVLSFIFAKANNAVNDHDKEAYVLQAGTYARSAAHSGRMALELAARKVIA